MRHDRMISSNGDTKGLVLATPVDTESSFLLVLEPAIDVMTYSRSSHRNTRSTHASGAVDRVYLVLGPDCGLPLSFVSGRDLAWI